MAVVRLNVYMIKQILLHKVFVTLYGFTRMKYSSRLKQITF